ARRANRTRAGCVVRNVWTPRRPLGGGAAPSLGCAMNSLALSLATFACSLSLALPPGWCCMLAPSRVQAGVDQVVQQAEESAPTARRSCCHRGVAGPQTGLAPTA